MGKKMVKKPRSPTNEDVIKCQQDGEIVETFVHAKISRRITKRLFFTKATPNQITGGSFLLIILASIFFATGNYIFWIVGGIILQFSYVLDLVDGELARLKNMQSRLGAFLDPVLDRIGEILLYLGICSGIYRQLNVGWVWILGGLAIATVFMITYPWENTYKGKPRRLTSDVLRKKTERVVRGKFKIKSSYFRFSDASHFFLILLGAIFSPITPNNIFNSMVIVLLTIIIVGTSYWVALFFSSIKYLKIKKVKQVQGKLK